MNRVDTVCPRCGAEMKQTGSVNNTVLYHCIYCGQDVSVEMENDDNVQYWQQRAKILERVRLGIFDWQATQWDQLRNDLISFVGRYEDAEFDVRLKMALIACLTWGFQRLDAETYKKCKSIFKATERIYKARMKALEKMLREFPHEEDVSAYQEYRVLYKKCRDEYRNTKLAWKAGVFLLKKVFFFLPG